MTILVLHVSDGKEDYLLEAEKEYIKRLKPFCVYKSVLIKEEKLPDNEENEVLIAKALEKEAERIRQKLPKRCYKVALCVEGKQLSSEKFADFIKEKQSEYSEIAFIIGSSHGLDGRLKAECDFRLSLSEMTFPHRLTRPILAEQVYRAFSIIAGKKYHK